MHCTNFADPIALTSSTKQTKVRTVRVVVCELQKRKVVSRKDLYNIQLCRVSYVS